MTLAIKKITVAAAAAIAASSVMAADGTINFSGEIVTASCSISSGAGANVTGGKGAQNVEVKLGKVSSDAIGSVSDGQIAAGTNINLNLDCGNTADKLTTVKVRFDPNGGSGVDPKNVYLLKTTGTAEGVGIGIYDIDNKLLNLAANETFNAPLVRTTTPGAAEGDPEVVNYSAKLALRAAYVKNGDPVKAGVANGTLPFTLTYE
ncbi:fimbrial protein [Burkholderia pseudomultivorans]|uniref:fimbrial protein n=1 Tax=Burkholderia pseudomultivorans TaxID=1207504 RepID=UPI000755B0EC|nr:fimbrial protein [Burkholderia pseudomultivorans]KVC40994.1 fimbrial protein [Burkholderia pseudomultivorans]